jgi:hypothetical protein
MQICTSYALKCVHLHGDVQYMMMQALVSKVHLMHAFLA